VNSFLHYCTQCRNEEPYNKLISSSNNKIYSDILLLLKQFCCSKSVINLFMEIQFSRNILFQFLSKPLNVLLKKNSLFVFTWYLKSGKIFSPICIRLSITLISPWHCSFNHLCCTYKILNPIHNYDSTLTATFWPLFSTASWTCPIEAALKGTGLKSISYSLKKISWYNTWKKIFHFLA